MKHQVRRKALSLLLALTMMLSAMPMASAALAANVVKHALLEPANAGYSFEAVGEALIVRENTYYEGLRPSRVVYETEDRIWLSERQPGGLVYTNVRGYVYSPNSLKYINIKTGEEASAYEVLQYAEDSQIHPAYSVSAGGYRYYSGAYEQVKYSNDSARTLVFDGVFADAGDFSVDSNYARVMKYEQEEVPASYAYKNVALAPNDIVVNKENGAVSFSITDSNLQSSYPCNQSFAPDNSDEHGWCVEFEDGTYTFQIGTMYFAHANEQTDNKTLAQMQSTLWVLNSIDHHYLHYADIVPSVSETTITWSFDASVIVPSNVATDEANVPSNYKINLDGIKVNSGTITHVVAAGESGSQAVPATTVTQQVYQIINKTGQAVYTDDGTGALATHYAYGEFHNDLLLVVDPVTYDRGYLNATGELAIPCTYESAKDFHNGYAQVYTDDGVGLIDTTDASVIAPGTYDLLTDVDSDGMLWAVKDNRVSHLQIVESGASGGGTDCGTVIVPYSSTGGGGGSTSSGSGGSTSGGLFSMAGSITDAAFFGMITAADTSAGTAVIGGMSLTYADGFTGTKLSDAVVGKGVTVYLDAAGKIAGYRIVEVSGTISVIHTGDNWHVTVGDTLYFYSSDLTEEQRIPMDKLGQDCALGLDGEGKIIYWYINGGGEWSGDGYNDGYITAVSGDAVTLRYEWDSKETTTYQYAEGFSGVKLGNADVDRWTHLYLDADGKITDYQCSINGWVVSATNSSVTLTLEDGGTDVTYNYSSSFSNEKLTTGAVAKRVYLNLNSSQEIIYCSFRDWGIITAADAASGTLTIRNERAAGAVNTVYSYADDFDGAKIGSGLAGKWIDVDLDADGKIKWYHISLSADNDSIAILSVEPTTIGRGETIELSVTVAYDLASAAEGVVYLGANTHSRGNYAMVDNESVTGGSGTVTLTATVTTAADWDTAIIAALAEANYDESQTAFAVDFYNTERNTLASGSCGENVTWTLNSTGTLTISGTGAMADYGYDNESRAPWYSYASSIKRVVIQSGITRIGSCAFDQCINLADVSIPDTVTTIGNNSFQLCGSLTSISFPNSLKTIEHSVFFGSGLTSVTVPDSVTRIDNSAFSGCGGLISAKLGNGIQKIDEYLFTEDSKLTSLTIPKNVTEIAPNAFSYTGIKKFSVANGNTAFSAEDGVLYNAAKTSIVCYPPQGNVNYIIPKTVGTVDLSLFWKTSIETIRISSSTTVTNTETIPDTFGSTASGSLKLYFQGNVTDTSGWEFLNKIGEKISVTAEQWEYHEDEIALSNAVLYVPYYANTVSTIDGDSLNPPFYASGLVDTGLEVDITGGFVTGAPLATGKTIFTVSSGAKTYTFSVTTRDNNTTTVTAETSEDLVIEKTVSNMTTATVTDQVFEIEDKDKSETTEVPSNFDKFLDVYLDGVKLVGGKVGANEAVQTVEDVPDEWEYYAEEGSTKITVRAQTLQAKPAGTHTIAATFAKVDADTNQLTQEIVTAAQNFTIQTAGGGGDGGGGSSVPQKPAETTKTTDGLSYSVSNGVASLDSASVTQLAASAGEQKSDTLTLDLTSGGETVTTVSLPAGLMDQIAQLASSGESSVDTLTIVLSSGSIELDAETLAEIAKQAGGASISMSMEEVSVEQLSAGQQAALAGLNAEKVISVEITAADKQITDFGGGRVELSIPFAPAADKNPRGYAVWHIAEDGKTTRRSTGYADGKLSFRTAHFSNYAVAYQEAKIFADVQSGAWYSDDVNQMVSLGLMNGVGNSMFAPDMTLNRAMVAQILYNIEKGEPGATAAFEDVPENEWYTDAVNWAAKMGIVDGVGDGKYEPTRAVTRGELVAMLYKYAAYKKYDVANVAVLDRFTDSETLPDWSKSAMQWAVGTKLISGIGDRLAAGETATRAQTAKVLTYFLEMYEQ